MKKFVLTMTMAAVLILGSVQVFAAGYGCMVICLNRCNFTYDSCILQCEGYPPACDASCQVEWDFCYIACDFQCGPI